MFECMKTTFKRRAFALCGATESWSVQIQTLHLNRWSRQRCFQCMSFHWSLRELKNDLQCSWFQVWKCGYEGCNKRNPDADDVQIGLEVYRQHIAATTSGMELMGGGSKPLPCNVKSDEMGYWIWICESLVIVLRTETCHRLQWSVKRRQRGEAMRERLRKRRSSRSIRFQRYSWLS